MWVLNSPVSAPYLCDLGQVKHLSESPIPPLLNKEKVVATLKEVRINDTKT